MRICETPFLGGWNSGFGAFKINKLANSGEPMLKNQYISTGTCTPAMKIIKNNFIKADFGTLGNIEFNFI